MAETYYSEEITAKDASSGEKYTNLSGVKVAEFNWDTVTAAGGTDDDIQLVELPAGSKIIGYTIICGDTNLTDIDLGTTAGGSEIVADVNIDGGGTFSAFVMPVDLGTSGKVHFSNDGGTMADAIALDGLIFYI